MWYSMNITFYDENENKVLDKTTKMEVDNLNLESYETNLTSVKWFTDQYIKALQGTNYEEYFINYCFLGMLEQARNIYEKYLKDLPISKFSLQCGYNVALDYKKSDICDWISSLDDFKTKL